MTEEHIVDVEDIQEVEEEAVAKENEEIKIEKGVVLYHAENGTQGYRFINPEQVSLEDISFYKRFLDQVEEAYWKQKMGVNPDARS